MHAGNLVSFLFFSALMSVLYHVRLMPLVVYGFSRLFAGVLRVSGAESLAAASNIFVGGAAALAPSRMRDLASLGVRALVAATLACLMTACAAGTFAGDGPGILGVR